MRIGILKGRESDKTRLSAKDNLTTDAFHLLGKYEQLQARLKDKDAEIRRLEQVNGQLFDIIQGRE